jgi:hypothetical protein
MTDTMGGTPQRKVKKGITTSSARGARNAGIVERVKYYGIF